MQKVCQEWGIDKKKVRAVVTDGGGNIKKAAKDEFGAEKHIACISHRLNLIGQLLIGNTARPVPSEETNPPPEVSEVEDEDMVDNEPNAAPGTVRELVQKVKRIVRFFKQSEVAASRLKELQKLEDGKTDATVLSLIQEVITRWNSCYYMLER